MNKDVIRFDLNNVPFQVNAKVYQIVRFCADIIVLGLLSYLMYWIAYGNVPQVQDVLKFLLCDFLIVVLINGYFWLSCYIKVDCTQGTIVYRHVFGSQTIHIADIQKIHVNTAKHFGGNVDIITADGTCRLSVREWQRFVEVLKAKNGAIQFEEI